MKLSHYSSAPLGPIRSVAQTFESDYRSCYEKPKGLWVSVDGEDDWAAWCQAETFGIGPLRHRIILREPHKLLILNSDPALRAFTEHYGLMEDLPTYARPYIDWPRVAQFHDGIIIAPYVWSCRMDLSWCYGWDCASGCIWNADAIESVEATHQPIPTASQPHADGAKP